MASLDKAFIKAYRQQGSAAGSIPLDTSGTESLVEALEERPLREAKKQSAVARHQGVLAALQTERSAVRTQQVPAKPPRKPAEAPAETDPGLQSRNQGLPDFLRPSAKKACLPGASRTTPGPDDDAKLEHRSRKDALRLDSSAEPAVPDPHFAPADAAATPNGAAGGPTSALGPGAEAALAACPAGEATHSDTAVGEPGPAGDPATGSFRPLLQVERLTASPVGERLQQQAAAELERLAAALLAVVGKGRKVVGFASDQAGQGVTTVIGSLALRLAERSVSVALVDANLANPQLASELGLLPEYGWEKALEASMPLDELVIESVGQPIGLMPLCREFDAAQFPDDFTVFREALAAFRGYYDVVLVDVGVPTDALIGRMLRTLDTVLLVCDARRTQTESLTGLHRALSRAGVNVAGIIESFVRGG